MHDTVVGQGRHGHKSNRAMPCLGQTIGLRAIYTSDQFPIIYLKYAAAKAVYTWSSLQRVYFSAAKTWAVQNIVEKSSVLASDESSSVGRILRSIFPIYMWLGKKLPFFRKKILFFLKKNNSGLLGFSDFNDGERWHHASQPDRPHRQQSGESLRLRNMCENERTFNYLSLIR